MTTDPHILITRFLESHDVSELTRNNYRNMLNAWAEWLVISGISWGEVVKPVVIRFRNEMKEKGRSTLYINNFLCLINKFYDFLEDTGEYPLNIAAGVKKFPRYNGLLKMPLDLEQVDALLKSIDSKAETSQRDRLIIKMMLTCGLRCIEVSRLNVEDLKLNQVPPFMEVLGKGKVNKQPVGMPDELVDDLKKYLGKRIHKPDHPVFLVWEKCHHLDRMTPTYMGIMIKKRMKSAGIDDPKISAHSLRHTYACTMIEMDIPIYDVQMTMRHTKPEMTQNYLRYVEDHRRLSKRLQDQLNKFYKTRQKEINYETNI